MMKKILKTFFIATVFIFSSCEDWLEVLPKNEQVTQNYWKSKEDVEAVLSSGYACLRNATPILYDWSELRGGSIRVFTGVVQKMRLQNFQLTSSDALCDWSKFYEVINLANSVIDYAPGVQNIDETYGEAAMKSHLTEAYFLRSLCYFYLLRNFHDVPLVLKSYVDDSAPFNIAKSAETVIINQIKSDMETALSMDAAKEFFDEEDYWSGVSKGRATKWALYALMADVCLWGEDYDKCIQYADYLINATASRRPAFMVNSEQWFEIFYPGNSNESIFEINWDQTKYAQSSNTSPSAYYKYAQLATYQYSSAMSDRLYEEARNNSVRAKFGAYAEVGTTGQYCIWKYQGLGEKDAASIRTSNSQDANYIIYRMADVMLMKAEALIWRRNAGDNETAIAIINQIRTRAGLAEITGIDNETDKLEMLKYVLNERDIEFAAEGKRWYDLIRFGKSDNYRYKSEFIEMIVENNQDANPVWLRSVLSDNYAWFLPIKESEIEANKLLEQNPYYGGTIK